MPEDGIKKLYYSIREVSDLADVEPHVLRFWEKEFPMLRPRRGRSGNRTYRERDVKIVLSIRDLLYGERYTIQGAVDRLKTDRTLWEGRRLEPEQAEGQSSERVLLSSLREMLMELRRLVG